MYNVEQVQIVAFGEGRILPSLSFSVFSIFPGGWGEGVGRLGGMWKGGGKQEGR